METDDTSPELDALRTQIAHLESLLPHLHSTLLSLPSVATDILSATMKGPCIDLAREALLSQQTHNDLTNHRLLAGVTALKIHDPDPQTSSSGLILGLRIELPHGARFLAPYFVFLLVHTIPDVLEKRPDTVALELHAHTLPVAVPVGGLARKYLPPPSAPGNMQQKQDLRAFVRALRHAVVSYHARPLAVENLRVEVGIAGDGGGDGKNKRRKGKVGITVITGSDAGHVVDLSFRGGIMAKLRMSKGGRIERVATRVKAKNKSEESARRRAEVHRRIKGGDGRIEGVVQRLLGGEQG